MAHLPITRMTLYKHGVGFFERRAKLSGEEVELSFRVTEMNDILKSLTAIDWGGGQVLGVDYATPQSREERLSGCSIRLDDDRSLRDLLTCLRGRRVELTLDQGEALTGKLLGLDEPSERQPLASSLVSLLLDETATVHVVALERVQGVNILDERGAADLRFFLQTSLTQEEYRNVTVRLSPGEHDLSVSYIAPAPTWRVSYRLVLDPKAQGGPKALLLGWGIFDNRLEEDLQGISLSLVAGMPISFVYDLYTPFTPERPEVKEEARVAAAPVAFAGATLGAGFDADMMAAPEAVMRAAPAPAAPMARAMRREALAAAQPISTKGEALGELFQYVIQTPVTVGRGQSAMVPVVSADLDYQKDLLYNGRKMPLHPVATLRMKNMSGLTLERGPVTVLDDGEYVGEAVLPFTAVGGEVIVPYAVELGAKIHESSGTGREIYRLSIKGSYLHFEEWDIHWQEYRLSNQTANPLTALVEHPRTPYYELFDTPLPKERTDEHLRFEVSAPAWGEAVLKVQERRLLARQEDVQKQSHQVLQRYLKQGLMDQATYDQIVKLLMLYDTIADYEKQIKQLDEERDKIYKAQQQIQGNMQALSQVGKEGALRQRYVEQLEATEAQLRGLDKRQAELRASIKQVEDEIAARLKAMG
ncbi:MAG TPA: hypothetical protein PLJ78_07160 [Anaerolineae bacterium]|nr:hypothetical protein [Anaerolineae bacterium]HQK13701.1 hypothetical protein [Anaerolineae bacterium]